MRSHSLVADFGAIVHWREPDTPVKDGALSKPFFRLPNKRSAQKAFTEKTKSGHRKALTRVQKFALLAFRRHCVLTIPMGAYFLFSSEKSDVFARGFYDVLKEAQAIFF